MTNTINIAASADEGSYVPDQLRAGDGPFQTRPETYKSGTSFQQYQVVAREGATGKIVPYDHAGTGGAEKAIGVTPYAVDATGGDVEAAMYVSGYFNTDALVWPAGISATQKQSAFDGTAITHRALL